MRSSHPFEYINIKQLGDLYVNRASPVVNFREARILFPPTLENTGSSNLQRAKFTEQDIVRTQPSPRPSIFIFLFLSESELLGMQSEFGN